MNAPSSARLSGVSWRPARPHMLDQLSLRRGRPLLGVAHTNPRAHLRVGARAPRLQCQQRTARNTAAPPSASSTARCTNRKAQAASRALTSAQPPASFRSRAATQVLEVSGVDGDWPVEVRDINNNFRLETERGIPILRNGRPSYRSIPARRG
eukprot:6915733-Prymnesium_polylepis.1